MSLILLNVFYCLAVALIASGQIWDSFFWEGDDEEEYKDENSLRMWFDDIDYNDTSLT